MKIDVVRPTAQHVAYMVEHCRDEDRREWELSLGIPLAEHLGYCVEHAEYCRAALDPEGRCLCIWGVDRLWDYDEDCWSDHGQTWLIAAKEAVPHALSLHRQLDDQLDIIDGLFETTIAFSLAENTLHHTWMDWLGYDKEPEPLALGPEGAIYLAFSRKQDLCASPLS
jgi:hypothetical protein